jgi:hypothetical protein
LKCAYRGTRIVFFCLQGIQKVDSIPPGHYHQKPIFIQ